MLVCAMNKFPFPFHASKRAFTLVELLTVIAIIAILAGLVLSTAGYIQNKAARSRAEAEIAAMEAALESYKADNGIYPEAKDRTTSASANNAVLLTALFKGDKVYMEFKPNQLDPANVSTATKIIDPWGVAYNYQSPGSNNEASFDLWSTAGTTTGTNSTVDDIKNW